jgi:hypothetical protein
MNLVHLRSALLCLTCEAITDADADLCPACGNRGLVPLRNWIKPLETPAEPGKKETP